LKEMRAAGVVAAEIAKELGVSRNAVIGKAQRLGLERLAGGPRRVAATPRRVATTPRRVTTPKLEPRQRSQRSEPFVPMFDLRESQCRFPMWAHQRPGERLPADLPFCGLPIEAGSSFCAEHTLLCYTPAGMRKIVRHFALHRSIPY
jgi:GcrA cell cycle regulator